MDRIKLNIASLTNSSRTVFAGRIYYNNICTSLTTLCRTASFCRIDFKTFQKPLLRLDSLLLTGFIFKQISKINNVSMSLTNSRDCLKSRIYYQQLQLHFGKPQTFSLLSLLYCRNFKKIKLRSLTNSFRTALKRRICYQNNVSHKLFKLTSFSFFKFGGGPIK